MDLPAEKAQMRVEASRMKAIFKVGIFRDRSLRESGLIQRMTRRLRGTRDKPVFKPKFRNFGLIGLKAGSKFAFAYLLTLLRVQKTGVKIEISD